MPRRLDRSISPLVPANFKLATICPTRVKDFFADFLVTFLAVFFFVFFFVFSSSAFSETVSPQEKTQRGIPVLMYHEIVPDHSKAPGSEVIWMSRFEEQMRYLHENSYQALSIGQLAEILKHYSVRRAWYSDFD